MTNGLDVEPVVEDPVWLEPFPHDPAASYELLEGVELAFVAALQHLPATQRAALILREVLGFEAAEVAKVLRTTVPAVNSAVQRARSAVTERVPAKSQQATLRSLGEEAERALVASFVDAWGRSDVDGARRTSVLVRRRLPRFRRTRALATSRDSSRAFARRLASAPV